MITDPVLRKVEEYDLPIFFQHQMDPVANHMAAFTARDPSDRAAFMAHWTKLLSAATVIARTIVCDGNVVGNIMSYLEDDRPEVTYWIAREHWGKGIATRALSAFLTRFDTGRSIYARASLDNIGSQRVLEKCGFKICLLYTSPSPRDGLLSRMPSSA